MPHEIPDHCPEIPAGTGGIAQRLMEAPGIGRVYERGVRPLLTAIVGGPSYAQEAAWIDRWLAPLPEGPILDLACGTGRYTQHLADRWGAERVVGMDLSWPMLRRARREHPALRFARASAQALPLADGALAGACSFGALHLFPDPVGALAELGRALRPGAPLVILTAAEPRAGLARRLTAVVGRGIRLRFLPEAALQEGLARGGLVQVAEEQHGAMCLLAARRSD